MKAIGEGALRRERLLETFLEELRRRIDSGAAGPRPTTLRLGGSEIPIETWEWESLVDWRATPPGAERTAWRCLVAEGCSLEAKILDDLRGFSGQAVTRADLHADAVAGFQLQRTIQRSVERLIVKGRIDQAKRLSVFRHRMADATAAIGRAIGEAELKEAEQTADTSPSEPLGADLETPRGAPSPAPAVPAPRSAPRTPSDEEARLRHLVALEDELRRRDLRGKSADADPAPGSDDTYHLDELGLPTSEVDSARPGRLRTVLAATLGAVAVTWLLLVLRTRATVVPPMARFALSDFRDSAAVTEVVARPPSLYVRVDAAAWGRMTAEARKRLIEEIGAKVAPAGYAGVHVTDGTGRTVARWLRGTGVRIPEPTASDS